MARQVTGLATVLDPDAPILERDTITCFHCQRVVWTKPGSASTTYLIFDRASWVWKEEPGAFCRICMHPICLQCCAAGRCTPWEKQLEASEAKDRLRRSVGV